MYMDALDSEVEALSAEVTRLRLMLHRVSQVMELPSGAPTNAPAPASRHLDPVSASLGTALPGSVGAVGSQQAPPPPTLAALEQILRAYPVELLEMLAKQHGKKKKKHTEGESHGHNRRHHRRSKTRRTPSSSSASSEACSSAEEEDASRSASSASDSGSAFSDLARQPPREEAEQQRRRKQEKAGKTRTTRRESGEGSRSKGRTSAANKDTHDRRGPTGGRESLSTDHGIPAALLHAARRSTVAKIPSEPSHGSREVSQSGTSQAFPNGDRSQSLSERRSQHPVSGPAATVGQRKEDARPKSGAGGDPRPVSIGDNILHAIRQQEEANDRDRSDSSSSGFLPDGRSRRAGVGRSAPAPIAAAAEDGKRRASPNTSDTASTPTTGAGEEGENTDGDMSYVSMSAINEMLRFNTTSPGDHPLDTANVGASVAGRSVASNVPAPDHTLLSGAGADNSYYNYSAVNAALESREMPEERAARRGSETGGGRVKVTARDSANSSIDHQHSRSHLHHGSSRQTNAQTPSAQESRYQTPSEARYSFSAFGSVAASGQSLGDLPLGGSGASARGDGGRSELGSRQSLAGKVAHRSVAMQPPSSEEASTTEDASALLQHPHAKAAQGERKAATLTSGPSIGRTAGNVTPTSVTSPSPGAGAGGQTPTGIPGVRTPHATRTVLQRLREQAEDSSDSDSSDDARFTKTTKQQPLTAQTPTDRSSVGQSSHRYGHADHSSGTGSAHDNESNRPLRSLGNADARQGSVSHSLVHPSHRSDTASSQQRPGNSVYERSHDSPLHPSMSNTGADAYSFGIYTPQYTPQQSPGPHPMDASVSPARSSPPLAATRRSQGRASPSASGAYDYGFGFDSYAATPQQQPSPGSAASPLSWLHSRSDAAAQSTELSNNLMAEGGYYYAF